MKWTAALVVVSLATAARAYTVSTPVTAGCHEAISAAALRHVRDELPTAGPIAPSRDDQAMIDDAPFVIDEDLRDLAGATLLFAVRDNDLKGNDPLDTFDVVPLAADPALQREHCLRAPDEDEPDGTMRAVADCAAFIHDKAADAIAGLDGAPPPTRIRRKDGAWVTVEGAISILRDEAGEASGYLTVSRVVHRATLRAAAS